MQIHVNSHPHLISSLSHELFGRLPPNGWHGDHPSNVIVHYSCGGLVGELLKTVVSEKTQCMCKHIKSKHPFSICCLNLNSFVQILKKQKKNKRPHLTIYHAILVSRTLLLKNVVIKDKLRVLIQQQHVFICVFEIVCVCV